MKFIIDAHLPPDLARWLSEEVGHDAKHVADIGLRDSEDTPIWRYAIDHQAVIVSKDEDFAVRVQQTKNGPAVVWLRIGNCSRAALMEWFAPLLPEVIEALEQGQRLVEVR